MNKQEWREKIEEAVYDSEFHCVGKDKCTSCEYALDKLMKTVDSLHLQEIEKIVEMVKEADKSGTGYMYLVPEGTPYSCMLEEGKWGVHPTNYNGEDEPEKIEVSYYKPTRDLLNRLLAITDEK